MKSPFLILFVVTCFFFSPVSNLAAQDLAKDEEILHLKEQIEQIILNNERTQAKLDAQLMAAKQKISSLETGNERLKRDLSRHNKKYAEHNGQTARRLKKAETDRQRLMVDNLLLRKQIEGLKLANKEGLAQASVKSVDLTKKSNARKRQLEKSYRDLEHKFQLAGGEILKLKSDLKDARKEFTRLKVEHVQLRQQHTLTEQKLASFMSGFNSQLASEKNKVSQISYQQLRGKQLVDSLRYELSSQGRMIQVLNQADRVNRDRIARLEQNEKKLEIERQRMQARQQLLSAREQELNRQISDMGQRENRYLKLEEKEKDLKMREQRLKHQTSSRGGSSTYGNARGQ